MPVENENVIDPKGSNDIQGGLMPSSTDVDVSQGFPVSPEQTPAPGNETPPKDAVTAPQTPVEGETPLKGTETPPETDEGTQRRLMQEMAKKDKMLSALGLDPNSDLPAQLEAGLISEADLRAFVKNRYGVADPIPPQSVTPEPDAIQKAEQEKLDAKQAFDEELARDESVSVKTNNRYIEAIENLTNAKINAISQQVTADKESQQVNESVGAVLEVARNQPEYSKMNPNLQKVNENVNLAYTGVIADREARSMGMDPRSLTPQQYRYFADKASQELGQLAAFFVELGQSQVRQGIRPMNPNANPPMAPSPPGGTPAPVPNRYAGVNVDTHESAARDYLRSIGQL